MHVCTILRLMYIHIFVHSGPTDHLADHQLQWLRVLSNHGVKAIVGHVKEKDKKKEKIKKDIADSNE